MPKDLTARNRIAAHLSNNGPVEDRDGRATAILKDAVGYTGTSLGFVQLISSMEKAGHITREVRGKRTYRIAVAADAPGIEIDLRAGATDGSRPAIAERTISTGAARSMSTAGERSSVDTANIDYDQLAAALLAQVTRAITSRTEPNQPTASVRRRLDQLMARNAELERETARARAERDAVATERDELRNQLEAASHNLSLLTERLGTPRKPQSPAAERLGSEERALLYRLSERGGSQREAVG
ncbi:MAG TPA: hypothetical protein VFH50_02855 [Acidimicrobiales bacterium]|nr:hypothetical protein [Acidimicrobiales bacterium]